MSRTIGLFFRCCPVAALTTFIAWPAPVLGQDPDIGPQIRIDVGGTTFASNETSMASTHFNPDEVVGVWNDWRRSGGSEVINMGVAASNDGGESWEDFLVRPPEQFQTGVEGDPMTAYDNRTGTLWVGAIAFGGNGGVYVAKKVPGENRFEPAVMTYTQSGADKCWMAAGPAPNDRDSTFFYIAFNRGLQRSEDMGATWNSPVSLGGGIGFLPRVGPNGEVYVSSWDFGNGVLMARSFDGGDTVETVRIATRMDVWGTQDGSRFAGTFRCPSMSYLAVDDNTGTLYAVWSDTTERNGNNFNVDLYFSKSTDQGSNWTQPRVINGDGDTPGDQFFPWLEVDQRGRIHMLFYDSRDIVQNDNDVHGLFNAYYSFSDDEGDTWNEFLLTPEPFDSDDDGLNRGSQFLGDYSGLAIGGDRAYPCYLSNQNGDSDIFSNVISLNLNTLRFEFPDGRPERINPAGGSRMRVEVSGVNVQPQPGTGKLHYFEDNQWVDVAMDEIEDNVYDAVFPSVPCLEDLLYYVSAESTDGKTFTNPFNAPDRTYSAIGLVGFADFLADDFETDMGWSVVNEDLTDGAWERGVPFGSGDAAPDEDFDGSGQCYVTGNRLFQDVDGGPTRLVTPRLDLADRITTISYARFFVSGSTDRFGVEVSNDDGNSWTMVEEFEPDSDGWVEASFVPTDFLEPTADFRVRFSVADNPNNSFCEAGLDAFLIVETLCGESGCVREPAWQCDGDVDGDAQVNPVDAGLVQAAFGSVDGQDLCNYDIDCDGQINPVDAGIVQSLFGTCEVPRDVCP